MSFTVQGASGSIWVGCREAARLGSWTFVSQGATGTVSAVVASCDDYWGSQPATQIRLEVGSGEWRWRLDGVDVGAGTYRVSGPPEER